MPEFEIDGIPVEEKPEKVYSFKEENGKAEVNTLVNREIKSLEDLIKVCKIDTNIWIVDRWECSSWGSPSKLRSYRNNKRKDKAVINTLFRVKAYLKKNLPLIQLTSVKDEIIADIKKHKPSYKPVPYKKDTEPYLYEIDPFDIHFGKHAWGKETGNDYDIEIAEADTLKCVDEHIQRAKQFNIEKFLLVIGNDFFNVDNPNNTTTAGTIQQEDTRWKKTFKRGRELIVKIIDRLRLIAPVDILVIPGNHDSTKTYFMGDALECWYHSTPGVNINNDPPTRKYYSYGKCLIGFAHGKDENINNLPTTMAIEKPVLFANAKFREWHTGDKHHRKVQSTKLPITVDETQGVTVRILRSISPADGWHFDKTFIGSLRAMDGFLWHKEKGLVAQFSANL
jgi:hypothetical protein